METVPKPDELLALHDVTEELFDTLKAWFDVPHAVELDVSDVDAAVTEMSDPMMIAALAMRKLQALRLLSTPGVRTSTDVVVSIIQDLNRALLQAPSMRLKRRAAEADWDAALVELVAGEPAAEAADGDAPGTAPRSGDGEDARTRHFRELHDRLHEAVVAVLAVSDGEIRELL